MSDWDVVSTAPKSEWDVVSTTPKAKPAAPVKEEPVYDVMGVPTGYTQPAQPGPSKAVREFERTEGPFGYAKEYGKGVISSALGTPAELTINLPSTLQSMGLTTPIGRQVEKRVGPIPRAGYGIPETEKYLFGEPKSDIAKGMRTAGEVLGVPSVVEGYQVISPLLKAGRTAKTVEKAEDAISGARKLGEELTTAAKEKGGKELLSREIAMKKEMARPETIPPEVSQIHDAARSESKLTAPDTAANLANKTDINSQVGKLAEQKFAQAETKQAVEGGSAFENYKQVASELQQEQPFGTSKPGKVLQNKLDEIIKGGSGDLRQYGEGIIKIARDVRRELFGATASDISPQEIKAVADTLPKSMSEAARNIQARSILESKLTQRKPVDFKVVDEKIRELRGLAANKNIEGFTGVQANRLKNVAKDIEDSLKSWVGEDVYPRAAYAEASEELNKFKEELSKVVSRKRGQYETSTGEVVSGSNAADLIFKDRKSVNLAKSLLGDAEVSSLAEKYAANELNGKTGKQIADWLKNPSNSFVYEVEGLPEKLQQYATTVARGEGDAKAYKTLQDQWAKHLDTVQKEFQGAEKTINNAARKIAKVDPAKLETVWLGEGGAPGLRSELESTKLFAKADLDALESKLLQASQIADAAEKKKQFTDNVMSLVKLAAKRAGLPVGAAGGVYGVYELFKGQ